MLQHFQVRNHPNPSRAGVAMLSFARTTRIIRIVRLLRLVRMQERPIASGNQTWPLEMEVEWEDVGNHL
jgi:hypothetical protein